MINGSIVALITPFDSKKCIDYNKLDELIEFQIKNQTDALLILGTTSESSTLTDQEKVILVEHVFKKVFGRIKIIIGISENSTIKAIELIRKFDAFLPNAFLVISPFYNKTNEEGLYLHFSTIARSTNTPIILYNIPSRTGLNIDIPTLLRLKSIENIIGIKEASKDLTHILNVKEICDNNFSLYCGNDDLAILFKALDAAGYINVYGNINPAFFKELYYASTTKGCYLFYKYYGLLKLLFIENNPIPIKALMNAKGFNVGDYRLPLTKMNSNNYKKLIECAVKVELENSN